LIIWNSDTISSSSKLNDPCLAQGPLKKVKKYLVVTKKPFIFATEFKNSKNNESLRIYKNSEKI
jgi:hypothetical protein